MLSLPWSHTEALVLKVWGNLNPKPVLSQFKVLSAVTCLFHMMTNSSASVAAPPDARAPETFDLATLHMLMMAMGDKVEFVAVLQDEGTPNAKKHGALQFKKIDKWSKAFFKRVAPFNIPGLPSNQTRAKDLITGIIVRHRKKIKRTEALPALTQGIPANKDEVYILRNEAQFDGV